MAYRYPEFPWQAHKRAALQSYRPQYCNIAGPALSASMSCFPRASNPSRLRKGANYRPSVVCLPPLDLRIGTLKCFAPHPLYHGKVRIKACSASANSDCTAPRMKAASTAIPRASWILVAAPRSGR